MKEPKVKIGILDGEKKVEFALKDDCICVKNIKIGKKFHWEKRETETFYGTLKCVLIDNKITVINVIPLEKYLISVISS
ncbi:MAG: SpoIID/LytB domain-containing protein, partial [Elusimicrobiota bacterium]|nr:SpoIID/LytB domain-containing protein [Elusimicrobiota bacterium]